jgi:hypothetical protein
MPSGTGTQDIRRSRTENDESDEEIGSERNVAGFAIEQDPAGEEESSPLTRS